jgi:hypothetical protein
VAETHIDWDTELTDLCRVNTFICMRTTLSIDDELFRRAKERAAKEGRTLSRVLEDALRCYLRDLSRPSKPFRLKITVSESRPVPGVDFADRDALYQRMETGS